jgi:hypothetical protein
MHERFINLSGEELGKGYARYSYTNLDMQRVGILLKIED